ncbi:hypothetical protein ABUE34_00810 [Kozakia baliensis]|uniref:hypothetical protein n=1 Tax=Kozakia baliensis TaxID=153496 RepID=UPI00345BE3E2
MVEPDFSVRTDAEIKQWIENYERAGKAADPKYGLLIDELSRRQVGKHKLDINKSIEHLKTCAMRQEFTTYGALAAASGVAWSKARMHMNGARGHLDMLLSYCHSHDLPYLPAICVNQKMKEVGELEDSALDGFIKGMARLHVRVDDPKAFHKECCDECWKWGARQSKL